MFLFLLYVKIWLKSIYQSENYLISVSENTVLGINIINIPTSPYVLGPYNTFITILL